MIFNSFMIIMAEVRKQFSDYFCEKMRQCFKLGQYFSMKITYLLLVFVFDFFDRDFKF